ncbi:peptidyl-prolyl cis-trans isomerase [Chryseosolibacter indicus]|uniref:Peptidyl-prolyl cis-trans isomerase n=1 Tax=Chryseosolibacter indicus TaxID=2782351 RepID=A0ABS5VP54_9BACT|nr:peptidyl-prolyl cis-trans isomerase [Chryseosolibacter indicus]MBT1702644.1 peptidyl-prolyl cis-trans isomerase [Chryseosolibacter indicus]
MRLFHVVLVVCCSLVMGCDFIRMKKDAATGDEDRKPVARVNNAYLYKDELVGIVNPAVSKEDSTSRVEAYIDSWIRKQLLIQEASKKININEAEVERKILDYRYSIIAYEFQSEYVKQNLDTLVSPAEIETYYKNNIDNFILKQNIVRATYVKVPKNAPSSKKIKDLILSGKEKDEKELRTYCLSFSVAYHISDSTWMVFDDLVRNSPLAEIPNKVQFLKSYPYYETEDENFQYYLRIIEYRISDNVSPLEFVRDEITNIILNKRKVELAKKLEDQVYSNALENDDFEIFHK